MGGECGTGFVSAGDDDEVIDDEWRATDAPFEVRNFVRGEQVLGPEEVAGLGVETIEDAGAAVGVEATVMDGGGGVWTGSRLPLLEAGFVRMGPDRDSRGDVIADGGFLVAPLFHGEGASSTDGEGGPTLADGVPPQLFGRVRLPIGI